MKLVRKLSLVKYDYDSLPEDWKKENPNIYADMVFINFGSVRNMKGHNYVQDIVTGKGFTLHEENLIELTEDEV